MDDGTPIKLSVTIDRKDGSAVFDFAGALLCLSTGPGCPGSLMHLPRHSCPADVASHASRGAEASWQCILDI